MNTVEAHTLNFYLLRTLTRHIKNLLGVQVVLCELTASKFGTHE